MPYLESSDFALGDRLIDHHFVHEFAHFEHPLGLMMDLGICFSKIRTLKRKLEKFLFLV